MYRKAFFGLVALSLCLAFVANVHAQTAVTTMAGSGHAKSLEVGGNLQFTPVYRSAELAQFTGTGVASESFSHVKWNVGLHAKATENIYGVLELENKHFNAAGAYVNTLDGVVAGSADIGLAYIGVNEFFNPNLNLKAGIFDLNFDLRGNGHPFLVDFTPASVGGDLIGDNGGWWLTYNINKNMALDMYWVKMTETMSAHRDDDIYGFHLDWKLANHTADAPKVVNLNLLIAALRTSSFAASGTALSYTLGGGTSYYLNPSLEIYGELYLQLGEYSDTVDAEAMAFYGGAKWSQGNYYVDGSLWYVTGDDATSGDAFESFMSFGGYHHAMILEDPLYGINLNQNFLALKVEAGYKTKLANEDLLLKAFLGNYTMQEDNGGDDGIGTEFDVTATWNLNPSLAFTLGAGFVFGSDVLEAVTGEDGAMMLFLNSAFTF